MTAGRWVALLAGAGALALLVATISAVVSSRRFEGRSSMRSRAEAAARALETQAEAGAELLDRLSEAVTDVVEEEDEFDDGPRMWSVLRNELVRPGSPAGAILEVFVGSEEEPEAGFEFLARIGAAGFEEDAEPMLPEALGHAELLGLLEDEEPLEDGVWCSRQGGRVALHRVRPMLEIPFDEEDERFVLLHVVTDLAAPSGSRVEVLCDMDGEVLLARPVPAVGPGSLASDAVEAVPDDIEIEGLEGRRPGPAESPRFTLLVARPDGAPLPLLPVLGVLLLLAAAVVAWRHPPAPPPAPPDLTGEAAHEMRTPLTVMRGKLEVALRRERTPEHYQRTLRECLDEVDGLEQLQDAILVLTRTAHADLATEALDLRALVEAEARRVRTAHSDREVSVESGGHGAATVLGDPSLLARAVGNLLDNAAKHSIAGGAILARVEVGGGAVRVVVEDDGPGVPVERHDLVFERFFRGPDVGRRGIPGSGLGLPLVRRIAELHGGRVRIEPRKAGRGRFVLVLPRG